MVPDCDRRAASMSVALVVGTDPESRCGVADYARCLADSLRCAGVAVTAFEGGDWSLAKLRRMTRAAAQRGCGLLHVQYPAIGFGTSLGPHLLSYVSALPTIVTLHEYSLVHPLRKLSMTGFAGGAKHLIFTSAHERSAFMRNFPWASRRSSVIPIGSNIPFLRPNPTNKRLVVFFGHIKPKRGLEQFLQLALIANTAGRDYRFRIIGTPGPGQGDYLEMLRQGSAALPVDWLLNLDADSVAAELTRAMVAYLPYPDGASPRRGSLWAVLGNGVPTITTAGPFCPGELAGAVEFADTPATALQAVDIIIADAARMAQLRCAAAAYIRQHSWESIAARHLALYRSLSGQRHVADVSSFKRELAADRDRGGPA
jgi:glycosyltransferase involved in cell wall biosynthesis